MMKKTNYTIIAEKYNNRYKANYLVKIEGEIKNLILSNHFQNILEAGCGTGRWINSLNFKNIKVFGLDYSFDMMKIAKVNKSSANLVNADAVNFPFKNNFFDLIFCVNAIHHFTDKEKFISECKHTLTSNGTIAIFGVDPHIDKNWYVYDYFDSVYANDLKRFPSIKFLRRLLEAENFADVEIKTVEQVHHKKTGNDIFSDPFLEKHNCSQLADLSDEEYQKGIEKIKNQIVKNPKLVFTTSVVFYLVSAKKNKEIKNANCN